MQVFCAFKKMLNCVPVIKVWAVYQLAQITGGGRKETPSQNFLMEILLKIIDSLKA
jgi:hypothetical protein